MVGKPQCAKDAMASEGKETRGGIKRTEKRGGEGRGGEGGEVSVG